MTSAAVTPEAMASSAVAGSAMAPLATDRSAQSTATAGATSPATSSAGVTSSVPTAPVTVPGGPTGPSSAPLSTLGASALGTPGVSFLPSDAATTLPTASGAVTANGITGANGKVQAFSSAGAGERGKGGNLAQQGATPASTTTAPTKAPTTTRTPSASATAATSATTATSTRAPTTASSTPSATISSVPSSTPTSFAQMTTPPTLPGWTIDMKDDFNLPIEQTKWGRYGWQDPKQGQGGLGYISQDQTSIVDGKMTLKIEYRNGAWYNAGVSSGDFFSAVGGRWEVRAKFPKAKGVGYCLLLYPDDGSWPPEINFAEGRVNGPSVMAAYHWDTDNKQELRFFDNPDMQGWHTYGVIIEKDRLIYTFDGKPWAEIVNPYITTKPMWVGFQGAAMDPNGEASMYETVDGGVPNALTPAVNLIEIDWVAHYKKA